MYNLYLSPEIDGSSPITCIRIKQPVHMLSVDLQAEASRACSQRKAHPPGDFFSFYCRSRLLISGIVYFFIYKRVV